MNTEQVWARLTLVFQEVFDNDEIELRAETTANDIEDWDSLINIQLLIAIEKTFSGVKFNTGEVAALKCVGEMVAVIQKRCTD